MKLDFSICPLNSADSEWVSRVMIKEWYSQIVVSHGEIFHPATLPGFAAIMGEERIGLLTYKISRTGCEIITLNSWRENMGVGTALIAAARQTAEQAGCNRMVVVTTNNNFHALRFYENRGFIVDTVRRDAIATSRKFKPQIPLLDESGTPIRDEIELEIQLVKNDAFHDSKS
jgi:GNAT superfamily N-acetyltransferase